MRGSKNVTDLRNLSMTVQQLVEGRSNATSFSQPEADKDGIITLLANDPDWVLGATSSDPDTLRIFDPTCSIGSTVILVSADFATSLVEQGFIVGEVGNGYFDIHRIPSIFSYAQGELNADDNIATWLADTPLILPADSSDNLINMTADIPGGRLITEATGSHNWSVTTSMWDIGAANNWEVELGVILLDTDGTTVLGSFTQVANSSIGQGSSAFDTASFSASGIADMLPGQSFSPVVLCNNAASASYDYIMTLQVSAPRPLSPELLDGKIRYAIQGP